nr:sulfatase [Candidatus Njordarchaeum guaymaensis]
MTSQHKPNIVFIVVDSLRSDHLSCYGYGRITTPYLDALSTKSLVFENAISPSGWTRESFSSILTGTYPSKNSHGLAPERFPTIMEVLRVCGYRTFGMTDNFFVEPLCKGLDEFCYLTRGSVAKMACSRNLKQFLRLTYVAVKQRTISNIQNLFKNVVAKTWLYKNYKRGPFFMFMDYSAHWPYNPPEPFLSRFLKGVSKEEVRNVRRDVYELIADMSRTNVSVLEDLYDGQVSYFDSCLQELVEHLKSLDLWDNTLLILTSDHGDLLGEHGLLHHEFVLYEPLIKVPLILRFPDLFPGGKRYPGLVQTLDILPTLIDYLKIDSMDLSKEVQGKSLLRLVIGEDQREFTISERSDWSPNVDQSRRKIAYLKKVYPNFDWEKYVHEIIALRTERYKYIWSSEGRHELY